MKQVKIREPIWKHPRSVGINDDLCNEKAIEIEITYKNKAGGQVFPDKYLITGGWMRQFPIQSIGRGVKLRIIPISQLEQSL